LGIRLARTESQYTVLTVLLVAVISVPLSFLATLFLWSLWAWFDQTFGFETIGQFGPPDWCFILVYLAIVLPVLWVATMHDRAGRAGVDRADGE
jgi:H+/Cl- antiporter ClcA